MVFQLGRVVCQRLFAKSFPGGSRAYSTHQNPSSDRVSLAFLVRSAVGGYGVFEFLKWLDPYGHRKALADAESRKSECPLEDSWANKEIILDHRIDEKTSMRAWN